MFENYSYKQKCGALVVVFIMLSVTAYKRSFSSLFQVVKEYRELSSRVADINKKAKNADELRKEIAYLDAMLGKEGVTKEMVQQGMVDFATRSQPGVSIHELAPIHSFSDENYTVFTNQLDVMGNTNQLLKMAYDFEKQYDYSRMVGIKLFTAKKNNKEEVLHLKMIFQNYENNK